MRRNVIRLTLCAMVFAFCLPAEARPAKRMPRIGWLSAGSSSAEFPEKQVLEGLHGLGWAEGKNVLIEFRHAAGNSERLSQMASELAGLNVDVIVTFSAGVAAANPETAKQIGLTITPNFLARANRVIQ